MSVSATTNGGLDITGESLVPMQRLFCTNNSNVLNCVRIYRLSSFVGVKSIYKESSN